MNGQGSYKIRIGTEADVRGVDQTVDALGRAKGAADQFVESIKAGVGIDIGGRIVNSVLRLPEILKQATMEGVAMNAMLQDGQRGLAALIGQFDSSAPADFAARTRMAAGAIDELRTKGLLAEGTFNDLFNALKASAGSAFAGGITDLSKQIDLIVASSQVLGALGGDQGALGSQLNQILSGNIDPANRLNQVLRLSGKEVKQLASEGRLFEEIMTRFAPTLRDAEQGMDSFTSQSTILEEQIDNLKTAMAEPVFDALTEGLKELNEALADPAVKNELRQLGFEIAGLVKGGLELTQWAIENADTLLAVAKSAGVVAAAFAAIKVKDILVGLGAMVTGLGRSKLALDAETAALSRNTAAQGANAAARRTGATRSVGSQIGSGLAVGSTVFTAGLVAQEAIAASIEAAADAQQANILNQSKLVQSRVEELRALDSIEAKKKLLVKLEEDINIFIEARKGANAAEMAEIDKTTEDLTRLLGIVGRISNAELERKDAAKAAAAAAEEQAKIEERMAGYHAKRRTEVARRGLAQMGDLAIEKAGLATEKGEESAAIREFLEQLKVEREAVFKIEPKTEDEAAARHQQLDFLQQLQERAREAEKRRVEELGAVTKENSLKALNEQLDLVEAQGQLKLAQLDAEKIGDEERASRRKQIEEDIASRRRAIEDEIAAIQEESDTARGARQARYAAEALQRANQLTAIERQAEEERQKKEWERGFRNVSGRSIDARSQRHYGMLGELLVEEGRAVNERPGYRLLNSPGVANMLQPTERPQLAQQTAEVEAGKQQANAELAKGTEAVGQIAELIRTLATSLQQAQTSANSDAQRGVKALEGIRSAIAGFASAIAALQQQLADLQRRVMDTRA